MKLEIVVPPKHIVKSKYCRSCGTLITHSSRRYCSQDCRRQMLWVLSLSTGLLHVFNARYAAFSFTDQYVILDVLPVWSRKISRFISRRGNGGKPAEDLKHLILDSGKEWYHIISTRASKSYASLVILNRTSSEEIDLADIRPDRQMRPRLTRDEREAIKMLQLSMDELNSEGKIGKIKSSYKRLAKLYHPDVGGDTEKFKKLNTAQEQMVAWAENPQFTKRKALVDCWSYDGSNNHWSPPL